jgi:lipoprotein-anchoring transpeptidase ErfK/SrfK
VAAKRIVVDKSEQRAYVYENGALLWTFVVSTGMPGSETWSGTFHVRSKIPEAYAYNWALRMPYWLGFYHTGYLENGFHALPIMSSGAILWDGYLGTPVSYGCVILSYPDATTLYNWAEIGTEVIVQP